MKLVIHNTTKDTVFFSAQFDTIVHIEQKPIFYKEDFKNYSHELLLAPDEKENAHIINTTWEKAIERSIDKKLRVIFFKKILLDKTKWEDVVNNQYYSKRLEFTVEELEKINWKVVYSDSINLEHY